MALIIGSIAMNKALGFIREPKDIDYFGRIGSLGNLRHDLGIDRDLMAESFWDQAWDGSQLDRDGFASIDELYTIKVSHTYWALKNNSWDKHVWDLLKLQDSGAQLDLELHKLLYSAWIKKHGSKQMNLKQAAGDFFDDAVVRIYDHDSIHRSCAYGDAPLYEQCLKDGETVDIDPAKMWAMDDETLVKLFREEIAATALERWILPNDYHFSPGLAWKLALRKTITSLTRGKSARFIVTNFRSFMNPEDYMTIHKAKVHKLEPFSGKVMM